MKIYLASDHAGYELKESIRDYLLSLESFEVVDFGADEYVEEDDYPDYIHKAGSALASDLSEDLPAIAIVFGGSGEGEAIVMNRYNGVRCTTYYGDNLNIIELGREHNDANSISFGARFVDRDHAVRAIEIFLDTPFAGGRHLGRVEKIDSLL